MGNFQLFNIFFIPKSVKSLEKFILWNPEKRGSITGGTELKIITRVSKTINSGTGVNIDNK